MTILLAVFTDGRRECISQTIPSALASLTGIDSPRLIFDDSADAAYSEWLQARFGPAGFTIFSNQRRLGFGGTIRNAWKLLAPAVSDFVFHLEDDFTFNRPVDVRDMAAVLDTHPHLAQLALRRQPWNEEERAAGGIIEQHPGHYTERSALVVDVQTYDGRTRGVPAGSPAWLEHRRFFTTNPCLYRRSLCERGWPAGPQSEGMFSAALFADPDVRCAFWGARDSGEWVRHIGNDRAGIGY